MSPDHALDQLKSLARAQKSNEMAAYHKAKRAYLGVSNPEIDALVRRWKQGADTETLVASARALWRSDIHEARVAAAKILSKPRFDDDAGVWAEISTWVADFDAWAIADHACKAGSFRLLAVRTRLDDVAAWTVHENMWVRRAALVTTLPWARMASPDKRDRAIRARILGWAGQYTRETEWFMQKVVGWWLRELSKRNVAPVTGFLNAHGDNMKPFARKEACKYL